MAHRKNVLLLTIDCFRYDRCGFNGHHRATTPTLDRLAGRSYVFDDAHATGPMTVESFPGIIAGLLSCECARVTDQVNWKAIPPDADTIATRLREVGYETSCLLTNPFLTADQNYDLGFDRFQNLKGEDVDATEENKHSLRALLGGLTDVVESRLQNRETIYNPYMLLYVGWQYRRFLSGWPGIHADEVVDRFIEDLRNLDAPFFGWTHFMDLHIPIHPKIANRGSLGKTSYRRHFLAEGARASNIEDARFNQIYDNALSYIDSQIARLLEYLRERDVLDETVIIVTGDHGEALHDRGIYNHPAHYLYDELLHVPLLVYDPDRDAARIDGPFSLAWLRELILELIGEKKDDSPWGTESYLSNEISDKRVVFSDSITQFGHSVATRNRTYKYVRHFSPDSRDSEDEKLWYDVLRDACFRISSDRGERDKLPGNKAPELLRREAKRLETEPDELKMVEYATTAEARARLKELGYKM